MTELSFEAKAAESIIHGEDRHLIIPELGLIAVFDGAQDAIAAEVAAEFVANFWNDQDPDYNSADEVNDCVRRLFSGASQAVQNESSGSTTASFAKRVRFNGRPHIMHALVGDSPIFMGYPSLLDRLPVRELLPEQSTNLTGRRKELESQRVQGVGNILLNSLGRRFRDNHVSIGAHPVNNGDIWRVRVGIFSDGVTGDWDGKAVDDEGDVPANQKLSEEEIEGGFFMPTLEEAAQYFINISEISIATPHFQRSAKYDDRTAVLADFWVG